MAKVALDLEVPVAEDCGGDWSGIKKNGMNPYYKLNEYFADRITQPISFEDAAKEGDPSQDKKKFIRELGRANIRYYVKQRFQHVEKTAAKSQEKIEDLLRKKVAHLLDKVDT